MDARNLRLFLALAENLHFGKTSREQHISPSALSRVIKQLEDETGAPLFLRDNRSVTLTREGKQFRDFAKNTLQNWEALRQHMQDQQAVLQGELSLYCSVTASYSFLYNILNAFREDHPQIELKLHTGDAERAVERVREGREDIAIGARPDTLPSGVTFQPIAQSGLCFIGPRNALLLSEAQRLHPNNETWQDVPMILSEEGLVRARIEKWLKGHNLRPRIYAQVAGNEAIVSMVSLGFGIGVVPNIVLNNSPLAKRIRVYDIPPALPPLEIGLFALEKRLKEPLIRAFWERRHAVI